MERHCENCGTLFTIDPANLERGWGICCSGTCATAHQEKKDIQNGASRARMTVSIGSALFGISTVFACISLIDGEYKTALWIAIAGITIMVFIARLGK
jgi:hypothetical protein